MRFEPRVTALMVALFGAVLVCLPALAATPNPNGIAVIIGNRDYTTVDVPSVTFAIADADAMKAFVVDTLGYLPANVLDLRNATQGQLNTMFGTAANPRGRLSNIVQRGVSEVVVFYAGHGVPSLADHARYLLPVEGDPNLADLSGYPVDLLQENLAKLGAKSVTVYLDACFTGSSAAGGQLVKGIAGTLQLTARDVPTITMLTASRADQVASWDPAAKHGLFTEFLLRGLTGAADAAPYGNGDRNVSAGEVEKYLSATMTPKARQLYGRDQNATVSGAPTTLLAALGPAKPVGPVITAFDGQLFANVTANVRTGPDAGTAPLGAIDRGAPVAVTGKSGDWYRVQLADGRVGFVLGTLLQAQPIAPLAPPAPPPTDPAQIELAFWNSIQASRNVADFDAYLRQYPKGSFVALANNRIAELRAAPAPATPTQQQAAAAPRPAAAGPAPAGPQVASGLYTRPGDVFRDTAEGPEMVVIPAGRFTMGSPSTEVGRDGNEGPTRVVMIPKSFAVSKYEVTRSEFAAFVRATNRPMTGGCYIWNGSTVALDAKKGWTDPGFGQTDRDPVVCVSWDDAKSYVAWLSQRTGQQYRLLTESEWEYAARAGTTTTYYWGNDIGRGNANCNGCGTQWDGKQTAPAGSFKANSFGLHDMLGNVYEWVEDCWHDSYAGAPTDGAAWTANCTSASRVLRGGSWVNFSFNARSANRIRNSSDDRSYYNGFRVARTL